MDNTFIDVKSVEIGNMCYESYPCKHNVTIKYRDGRTTVKLLSARDIVTKLGNFMTPSQLEHFSYLRPGH